MDLITTRELASVYICKAIERMSLAEFKVLRHIFAYAALPASHLIKIRHGYKYMSAMCCTHKYIYYYVIGNPSYIYVRSYITNKLVTKIKFLDYFNYSANLKYCNGIVHFSLYTYDHTIYKLIDAENHTVINTFKITDILYMKYSEHIADAPPPPGTISTLETSYFHHDEDEHLEYTYSVEFCIDGCVSKIYHFKHDINLFDRHGNILFIYSSSECYIYYIDTLLDYDLNDYIVSWPRGNRNMYSFVVQLANILYVVEDKQIIIIDLIKKTIINRIDCIDYYVDGCLAPNGNLLLIKDSSSIIHEYF